MLDNVTVNEVAEAVVTVPSTPLLNVTVLLAGVVSKPSPLITIVVELAARVAAVAVTTG